MTLNLDRSKWRRVTFGDVIESVTDRVDDPSQAGVDRYVGLEHLDPGIMTVQRWDSPDKVEAQKLRFQPGDVIFGRRRAYQKKVALAEFEGICSAHALVLRARQEHILPGLPAGLPLERLLSEPSDIHLCRVALPDSKLARSAGPGIRPPAARRTATFRRPNVGRRTPSRNSWRT